jgi:Fic family protein
MHELSNRQGRYITVSTLGETFKAYVPPPLPPEPSLRMENLLPLLERATQALGRLDGIISVLPDIRLFLYQYVRKEALLSSQIEGTQSSFSDLLLHESEHAPGVPLDDVQEVSAYVAAMEYGLKRMGDGFPLSLRLVREIHEVLLATGRGKDKQPGEFRRSQNWIGGTRPGNALFVPPPPEEVMPCLDSLEKFLHETESGLPVLVKAGLIHLQFETIHPFLDGNGRVGRLLITLMLCDAGLLKEPSLYLSLYFKTHRQSYYRLLQEVREAGTWETWLEFFLTGVEETANGAIETVNRLLRLFEQDTAKIGMLGRAAPNTLRLHQALQSMPIIGIQQAVKALSLTPATVGKAVEHLEDLGILREVTGKQRDRLYAYQEYLQILSEGTAPLSR